MLTLPRGLVWIASYPKSGNTWLRILLSNLISGASVPENINNLSLTVGVAGDREIFEDETHLDSHLLRAEEIEHLRPAVHDAYAGSCDAANFVKAHDAWTRLADGTPVLGCSARRAIYIVRDPRDVAVSFAFFQARRFDELIDEMNCTATFLGPSDSQVRQKLTDWSGHVRSWLDQTDVPVHLIRYEDLLSEADRVLRRMLIFLGGAFESDAAQDDAIARAVRHADFAGLQQQERQNGFRERAKMEELFKRGGLFFRQGQTGSWRRHLSEHQARRIENAHADMMARLRYTAVMGKTKSIGLED